MNHPTYRKYVERAYKKSPVLKSEISLRTFSFLMANKGVRRVSELLALSDYIQFIFDKK